MRPPLIIPVENQVRELEPKILLACIAARRGFAAVIGSRLEVDFHIASFPRSIYLSKSMTQRSVKMFRIMRKLGHQIVVWDEEALVHPPAETYFTRRLSSDAIGEVSHLFAWGEENAELWRAYPHYSQTPIHITGNPRGDMLRPELRVFYADPAQRLRDMHGDFILIDTNFGVVNAFNPSQNLFIPDSSPERIGRAAVGMCRDYATGLRDHKQVLFEHFQQLVPAIEQAFPRINIIIRPHPVEKPDVYHDIASRSNRVRVATEGNVIPWLLAARMVIHNGCTTGVEAYALEVPAIAYQPAFSEYYDEAVFRLPNRLSHQCFNFEELAENVSQILDGTREAAGGQERSDLIRPFLCAQTGPLAGERIVDVLAVATDDLDEQPRRSLRPWIDGWQRATRRRMVKKLKGWLPGSKYRPTFQRHRYPGLTLVEMRELVTRFQKLLGDREPLSVDHVRDHIFRIAA